MAYEPFTASELVKLKTRIVELEAAIRDHRRTFPDEPLQGELDLWEVLENKDVRSNEF